MHRGSVDFLRLCRFTEEAVFFVTRTKQGVRFTRPASPAVHLLSAGELDIGLTPMRWLDAHTDDLRLFFLPGDGPELNPDESLNHDVKANALGRRRAHDQGELVGNVRTYLRITQKHPQIVQRYFYAPSVQYAAA